MANDVDWWVPVRGDKLEQGHLLQEIVHPLMSEAQLRSLVEPGLKSNVKFQKMAVITATQSCDFENEKVKRAVVVKVVTVREARKEGGLSDEALQQIRDGQRPLWTLLASPDNSSDKEEGFLVDFRWTISLPIAYLKIVATEMGDRPALRSPYLEYFSAAFARCFGRVALPNELPAFVVPGNPAMTGSSYQAPGL